MKILLGVLDKMAREILERVVKNAGLIPTTIGDGWQVLKEIRAAREPILAIVHSAIPGLSSLPLCREARKSAGLAPLYLVVISQRGTALDHSAALEAGADDFIVEPFSASVLEARIGSGKRVLETQQRLVERVSALEKQVSALQIQLQSSQELLAAGPMALRGPAGAALDPESQQRIQRLENLMNK
jgi:DNA-binding response OmpR family regulator